MCIYGELKMFDLKETGKICFVLLFVLFLLRLILVLLLYFIFRFKCMIRTRYFSSFYSTNRKKKVSKKLLKYLLAKAVSAYLSLKHNWTNLITRWPKAYGIKRGGRTDTKIKIEVLTEDNLKTPHLLINIKYA